MGKGTILSALGYGQYSVRVMRDVWRITNRREALARQAVQLDADAATIATRRAAAAADLAIAESRLNDAIGGDTDIVQDRERAVTAAKAALLEADSQYAYVLAQSASVAMERASLEDVPDHRDVTAWCADYSEGLSGDVGTVEVFNLVDDYPVQIRPGYDGAAAHSTGRDGLHQPVESGDAAAVFYNWAMVPGVERWRPLYSHARITYVAADSLTCGIIFTDGPRIGEYANDVTFSYMDCGGAVFVLNDDILVQYTDRDPSKPVVIGFKDNPRPCIQICASIYDFYFNMYADSTFLAFYNAWTEKNGQWIDHVDRWKAFTTRFITTVNLMPDSDLKTLYLMTYNEYVYPRYQSILEASVPIQNARAVVVFLYTEYIKAFQGQLAYRKIKEGVYADDGTGSLSSFDACTLGGFSRIHDLAYNSIASMPYALRYSLAGAERLKVNLRTYWNPDALKANVALDAISAQPFPATGYILFRPPPDYAWTVVEFANPTLGHTIYLDGVAIGTRTATEFTLQTEYSVDDKSEHVVSIMTDFRLPNIPTGTLPTIDWENQPVPCPPASVPPATPIFEVAGTTDMTVNGGTFKVFVTKFPEE
ncbi:MAG TPA: hypothetical protein VE028_03890 [Nitratidesulfovibrio sp.]|nr:hypothetical protein [Nitratidesulfovibrio sp.]